MGMEVAVGALVTNSIISAYSAKKNRETQKKQQRMQQDLINKQNKEALDKRKLQIDQQREQIGGGFSTSTTGETGITGSLSGFGGSENKLG